MAQLLKFKLIENQRAKEDPEFSSFLLALGNDEDPESEVIKAVFPEFSTEFFPNIVQCVIAVGQYKGNHVFIPRINLHPSASAKYPFQFERKQFPLKLSFAMTINKSQGKTLNRVSVYLPCPCFSHGQLYVSLSRYKKQKDVTVFAARPPAEFAPTCTKNIVCYEVLRLARIINPAEVL
ncbi:ATP-dependent DNA helicase PIF6-like [Chenopodium quinoa]|uniref:ATP-dependent DNA helicase PIF6-like n=1 Tax=Chenopodium quinoa TaxID=63459 RepID=UPI000B78DF8E|nr:ATP-dependent DNA helicase PIF6-like [Chenopodium quinoa]